VRRARGRGAALDAQHGDAVLVCESLRVTLQRASDGPPTTRGRTDRGAGIALGWCAQEVPCMRDVWWGVDGCDSRLVRGERVVVLCVAP